MRAAEAIEDSPFAVKVSAHTLMAAVATLETALADLALIGPNQVAMMV